MFLKTNRLLLRTLNFQGATIRPIVPSEIIKTNECLCLGNIGLIVAPWKFDVLKTIIFALEASLFGQIIVLRTSHLRGATISP